MPQAADIIVNNGASVAKTFTLIHPSAGLGGLASWSLKEGAISAVFPTLTAMATRSATGMRTLQLKVALPSSYTDSSTGLTSVGSRTEVHVTVRVPDTFPESLKNDHVAFATNLINSALIKALIRDAVPAT